MIGRVQGSVKTQLIAHDKEVNDDDVILCNLCMHECIVTVVKNNSNEYRSHVHSFTNSTTTVCYINR